MDCSTFLSKITGKINCDAIRKTGAYGPSWLDVFDRCTVIVYSETNDLTSGNTILIKNLDKTNPPKINQIEFRKNDKHVSTVPDSFANQALAQLPYESAPATMDRLTFQSRITGPIDLSAMTTESKAYRWWQDIRHTTATFSSTGSTSKGTVIMLHSLNRINPPSLDNIRFREDGNDVEKIPESFADQALTQLPYKSEPIPSSPICNWIAAKGGKTSIKMFDVLDIIGAYKGMKSIGFTPKTFDVVGVLAYYKGKISDGDTFITC